MARAHPPAYPHGKLVEILPDLFFVSGTIRLPGPLPIRFGRNMTVVRRGERLVVINSVRLDDAGLAELDKLGKVTDVIRIAANHGMDDPFYAEHYGAKVSVVKGQRYTAGFAADAPTTYFTPDHELEAGPVALLDGARLITLDSKPPEGLLLFPDGGGTVISGDCLQNWAVPDDYTSWLARPMMKMMGLIKPYNIGPRWFERGKPPRDQMRALLDLAYENVLPGHGTPVLGGAARHYRAAIERVTA